MVIDCTLTPKSGGGPITVKHIYSVDLGVSREPSANARLGGQGHEIRVIRIEREKSLAEKGGKPDLDNQVLELSAAREQEAYFSGEITIARPDDEETKVETIRWDEGFICDLAHSVSNGHLVESFEVCVTKLKVDNSEFLRTRE